MKKKLGFLLIGMLMVLTSFTFAEDVKADVVEGDLIYIVSKRPEDVVKAGYLDEFGQVRVVNSLDKIFKSTSVLEELKGKSLKVVVEEDLFGNETVYNIPKEVKEFCFEGREQGALGQNIVSEVNFYLNGVKSSFANIGVDTENGSIIGAGPGHSIELAIKNSKFNFVWGVDSNIKEFKSTGESEINVSIEDSVLKDYQSIASLNKEGLGVKYKINFNSKNTDYTWLLGPGVTLYDRGFQDLNPIEGDIEYNLGDIKINIDNCQLDKGEILPLLNEFQSKIKNIDFKVGRVDINLNKVDGSKAYAILEDISESSVNSSFGDVNIVMKDSKLGSLYMFNFSDNQGRKDLLKLKSLNIDLDGGQFPSVYLEGVVRNRAKNYEKIGFEVAELIKVKILNTRINSIFTGLYALNNNKNHPQFVDGDIVQKNTFDIDLINSEVESLEDGRNITNDSDLKISFKNSKINNLIVTSLNQKREFYVEDGTEKYKDIYEFKPSLKGEKYMVFENDNTQEINNFYGVNRLDLKSLLKIKNEPKYVKKAKVALLHKEGWKMFSEVISVESGKNILGDEFIQAWPDQKDNYNLAFRKSASEDRPSIWMLSPKVTLHSDGRNFDNSSKVFEFNVFERDFKVENIDRTYIDKASNIIGWTMSKDGSEESDPKKRSKIDGKYKLDKNIHLYAIWKNKDESDNNNENSNTGDPIKVIPKDKNRELVGKYHSYIRGYKDGTVRPKNNISREEVAVILYRLMDKDERTKNLVDSNNFVDVEKKSWSNREISTLYKADFIEGYAGKKFRPKEGITRAELATILNRFKKLDTGKKDTSFSDLKDHWAKDYIVNLENKGWIEGYPDGSFRPDKKISRQEFIKIMNRMLERKVDKDIKIENIEKLEVFKDNKIGDFYYLDLVEGTNSYILEKTKDGKFIKTLIENK